MYQLCRALGHTPLVFAHADPAEDGALIAVSAALAADRPLGLQPLPSAARLRRHGLGPLAHTHGAAGFLGDYAFSAINHDRALEVASEAVGALAAVGIAVALYKGIAYAGTLYPDPAERPLTDVDLLVAPRDADRAFAAIARLGYRHTGPADQRAPRTHAMTLKRPGAAIDLHRGPMQLGRAAIPHEAVLGRARPAAHLPGALRLEPVDEILYHLAHIIRSDLYVPLLSFVDTARLLAVLGHDRRALTERAAAWRMARPVRAALSVIDHVIAAGPPPAWWLPGRSEVLRRTLPRRHVQVARKLLLIEGPKELAGFAAAIAAGLTYPRGQRRGS